MTVDGEWLRDTLSDALETLSRAVDLLQENPRKATGVLEHEIPELYAKLNYAVNTAEAGPSAIETMDHDDLIAWPAGMPFRYPSEEDPAEDDTDA